MGDEVRERRVTREVGAAEARAAFVPSSVNSERRTVDVVWTTGARVMRGIFDRYIEELSLDPKHVRMGRLEAGAPLLDSHRSWETRGVIGVVEKARLEKKRGVATVRFAKDDPQADAIFSKIADGILRNVSVGYRVHRLEKVEERDDSIPVYRATDWEPMEISVVPIGADAGASVRAESAETNLCEFVEREPQERNMPNRNDPEGGAPAAAPAPAAPPPTEHAERAQPEPAQPRNDEAIAREATAIERRRIAAIHRTAAALGIGADLARKHVDDGTSSEEFQRIAIDAYAAQRDPHQADTRRGVDVVAGEDARDKWLRGAGDWLLTRSGAASSFEEAAKLRGEPVRVDPGDFRGLSCIDLARASLERAGVRTAGMDKMTLVGKALTHRTGGMATTSDFPVLLESTVNKILLAAFGITPDTWRRFCATGSVSDFRPHKRLRMGSFGRLDTVNEHGEFKNKPFPGARAESISADTKGNIVGITRQALVNDDVDAFTRVATMLGRAARLSIEADVYDLLALNGGLGPAMTDGNTLFHANHNNIAAGSALSVDGIDSDRQVLAEQTDESGNDYIELRPAVLLVPLSLGSAARVINASQYEPTANMFQKPNVAAGTYREIVDTPRLTGTRRYSFADPNIAPVVEVVFLDGQQNPFLETQDGWRIDGVEWKVRLDYGVGAVDYRGAVTNAGA